MNSNKLTHAQVLALYSIYHRDWNRPPTYLQFRRSVSPPNKLLDGAVIVPFCNMLLVVEQDGYAHS